MNFGAQITCYRNSWDDIRNVAEALDAGPLGKHLVRGPFPAAAGPAPSITSPTVDSCSVSARPGSIANTSLTAGPFRA